MDQVLPQPIQPAVSPGAVGVLNASAPAPSISPAPAAPPVLVAPGSALAIPQTKLTELMTRAVEAAKTAKQPIETRILECRRMVAGMYEPTKLAAIRAFGGAEAFYRLARVKRQGAMGWMNDLLFPPAGDRLWGFDPTTIPDLPEDAQEAVSREAMAKFQRAAAVGLVMTPEQVWETSSSLRDKYMRDIKDEARTRAARMEGQIADVFDEGGFNDALAEAVEDMLDCPSGVLKGPFAESKKTLKWENGKPVVTDELAQMFVRVDPLDIYPSPNSRGAQSGYICERKRYMRQDVEALRSLPGIREDELQYVLDTFGKSGNTESLVTDSAREQVKGNTVTLGAVQVTPAEVIIDGWEFWGELPGEALIHRGVEYDGVTIDESKSYPVCVLMVAGRAVQCQISPDPLGRNPYHVASWHKVAGSFWGESLVEALKDPQEYANSCFRNLIDNIAMCGGPQIGVDKDSLPAGTDTGTLRISPRKVWALRRDPVNGQTGGLPIQFFQPESNVGELVAAKNDALTMADEASGVPRYAYGNTGGQTGAAATASGLSMLLDAAGKTIKNAIRGISKGMIEPAVAQVFTLEMLKDENPDSKGDIKIVPRGAAALLFQETQAAKKMQFLDRVEKSPVFAQLAGPARLFRMFREAAKSLDINPDGIIPDDIELAEMEQAEKARAASPPPPMNPQGMPPQQPGMPMVQGGEDVAP